MTIKSATTVAMEFRAPAEQDGSQFVFRAEITAEDDAEAFDRGATLGQLVAKIQEGFRHGTAILTPINVEPVPAPRKAEGATSCFTCGDSGKVLGPVKRPNGETVGHKPEPCPVCQVGA